ncbi:F-box domain-containing protein [Pleurotus pulmonarius]|nr:hypothetical protein EYR36_008273 [Pleurotus pulmonarius]
MESPPLPPELFQMILELVDSKEALFPLLLVSRAFKALVEPLLFKDVVATTHDLRRLQGFYLRVVEENDRLSSYVRSLTTSITVNSVPLGDRKTAALDAILGRLRNLKRLNLLYHWEPFVAFPSLSPTAYPFSLTHFACSNNVHDIGAFTRFLETQSSLEYLSVPSIHAPISLSPSALPRLRILQAPLVFAVSVMSGRKVSHLFLNTPIFDDTIKTDGAELLEAFDNLRSLHCVADDLLKLAPFISSVRCVWLMLRSVGLLEDFLPFTEALATMHIQYLRLSGFKPGGNHSNFVDQLYEENQFLRSVDLKRSYSEYSRYTVGKSFPVRVDVGVSAFDEWWLECQACKL